MVLALLVLLFVVARAVTSSDGRESIAYSRFLDLVANGQVIEAEIGAETVGGVYREGGREVEFVTTRPPGVDEEALLRELRDHGVEFTGSQPSGFSRFLRDFLLIWVLPLVVLFALWRLVFRRIQPGVGAMTLGRSQHKVYLERDGTTFADVAGVDEAVEELREVVDFLRNPERYRRLGGRIPKGVLLVGAPGTGKTLLARAVAGEAGVPFFYLSGSNFVEMFVGLGAARVRDLFDQAKAKAPCIVFIDELDTIGRSRAGPAYGGGAHEEREQTLNQLLNEIDGFDPSAGVILMAATNRPEVLDPALLRPGRFDRQIVVDVPDRRGRAAILRVHARGVGLGADVDLDVIAARTPGFAGAELANVVNEAALLAARRGKETVSMLELLTQPELEDRLAVLMGGRAAERLVYGDLSTGAQNDLQQATALARRMVEEFGMSERLGPVALTRPSLFLPGGVGRVEPLAPKVADEAETEVKRLLEEAERQAEAILAERRADLDRAAVVLLERETLEKAELEAAFRRSETPVGGRASGA